MQKRPPASLGVLVAVSASTMLAFATGRPPGARRSPHSGAPATPLSPSARGLPRDSPPRPGAGWRGGLPPPAGTGGEARVARSIARSSRSGPTGVSRVTRNVSPPPAPTVAGAPPQASVRGEPHAGAGRDRGAASGT